MELKTIIKKGYKQTEIGVIPEDWEVKELGAIGIFNKGKGIKKDEVKTDGIPCVRYGQLYTVYNNIIKKTVSFISEDIAKKSFKLTYGDLLFAGSGETKAEIGKSAVILRDDTFAGGDIVVFRSKKMDYRFLGYISNAQIVNKQKALNGQGDAVVHIYSSGISKIKIPIPPLSEQKAIAEVLGDMDGLLAALGKKIAKKRLIKKGAMQELLRAKEGWEVRKLGDYLITKPKYGINAPAVNFDLDLPTYLRITDIDEYGNFNSTNKASVNNPDSGSFYLSEGEIVLARTGASVGKSYLYNPKDGALVYAGFLICVKPNEKILNSVYLSYFLQTDQYKDWVKVMSMRSGQPGINGNEYAQLKIPIPKNLQEQTRIATILSDMDAEITGLEAQLKKYEQLKQALMQDLLTGRVRL